MRRRKRALSLSELDRTEKNLGELIESVNYIYNKLKMRQIQYGYKCMKWTEVSLRLNLLWNGQ